MHQQIQGKVSHDWILEQGDPIPRGSIAGNNDRRFHMTLGYNLAEIFPLNWMRVEETKLSMIRAYGN